MSTDRQHTLQTPLMADRVGLNVTLEDAGGLMPAGYQKPAPSSLIPKTVSSSQSLAVAVDRLVNVVVRNESQLLTSLKSNDYQQLIGALDALTDIVGESKNHYLISLMDSIDILIEKCKTDIAEGDEEEFSMKVRNYPLGSGIPKLHRVEKVGRPDALPRLKLADLLAKETDTTESEEIDTGPPVGNEVW